jgi:hypothetical protein
MENKNIPNNFKALKQQITIIHGALLMGLLMFGAVVFYTNQTTWNFQFPGEHVVFLFVLLPLLAITIPLSRIISAKRIETIADKKSTSDKVMALTSAYIIRYALIEGPTLFAIVVAMLSHNTLYLFMAGLAILYFITQRPTKQSIKQDLALTNAEEHEYYNVA